MIIIDFLNRSAFFLGTLLVVISCLIFTLTGRHTDKPQNAFFITSLFALALSASCEIVQSLTLPLAPTDLTARYTLLTANFFYFLIHSMQPMLLFYYALHSTRNSQRMHPWLHALSLAPAVLGELLVIANPWTHMIWYFDEQCNYHRGAAVYYLYFEATVYFFLSTWLFLFKWTGVNRRKRLLIFYSLGATFMGILIQLLNSWIATELFLESVGYMGLMLSLEYDEDRLDVATGVYNRGALMQDTRNYFENDRRFYAICIRFTNQEVLKRSLGVSDSEEVFRLIADYLAGVHPRYMIYRVTPTTFVLLHMRGNEGQVRFLAQMIAWKMEEGWSLQDRRLPLHGVLLYAAVPDELHSPEDIILMCESPLPKRDNGAILVGEDLREILYRANLETALHRGIAEQNFRVYYQPVYSSDGDHIYSAESLVRLKDPEFGEMMPGDFIPAAERNGMIEQIGEYTLEEVCRLFESGLPDRLGIHYINVNLSVVQCMSPGFTERVKEIVGRHTVDPARINFEITETVATLDYVALDAVIKELKGDGFMFSMEGYGTGYSNLYSIFSLDFDMIKMDRRLLWEAGRSEDGWIVLENSVRLVHKLSHEVVIVGVETKEQFERMRTLSIDWYQGNYFSPPLTREELGELV